MKKHDFLKDIIQKSRLYYAMLKAQHSKKNVPVIASLFITGRCNSRCFYCYVDIDKKPEREFSFDEWKKLIDNLYERGCRMFALVGGEPLLHPDVDNLVEYIMSKNVFLNLTTNGFLMQEHLEAARKATEVSISLDGDLESHNLNRGKLNFERAIKGIDLAKKNGVRVRLCTVITRHNFDQIDFLVKFSKERNMFITFSPLIGTPEARREAYEDMRLSDEKIREFFIRLKEAKKRTPCIINSFESMDYMIGYPIKYGDIVWKESPYADYYRPPCPYGRLQYIFTNIGEVYPCQVMWNHESFQPKNIFDVGLDEALIHASTDLKCQCCSFANAVDWNSLTSLPWFWYGLKMTIKQAF